MSAGQYDETLDLTPVKVTCTGATKASVVAASTTGQRVQPRHIILSNNDTVAHRFDLCEGTSVKVSAWVPTKQSLPLLFAGWKLPRNTALQVATDATATTTEPDVTLEYDMATG